MKRFYAVLVAALLLRLVTPLAQGAAEVSVDFFYNKLEPYGDWLQVADYGYCWHPRDVGEDWRPYSEGRWAYTDAGWTWDSHEPFGWAVYHYGRWAKVEQVGWVWVPGSEWGPAWVSWRRSPRYIGWAPLPPEAKFAPGSRLTAQVDTEYDIGPEYYSFVEVRNFGAPRLHQVLVEPRENITIIQQTRNITRITYENNFVVNEGPRYDVITREVSEPIPRLRLEREQQFDPKTASEEQLKARVEGNTMRVAAFPVNTHTEAAPAKVTARVEKAQIDHGWKHAGPPAEVQRLRAKLKSEPAPVAEGPEAGPETRPGAQAPQRNNIGNAPTSGAPSASPESASPTSPQRPATGETTRERGTTPQEPSSAAERRSSTGAEASPSPSASGSPTREHPGAATREGTTAPRSEASPTVTPSSRTEASPSPSASSETTRPESRRERERASSMETPSGSPRATTRGSAGAAAGETAPSSSVEPQKHLEKHGKSSKHGRGAEPESAAPSPASPPQASSERTGRSESRTTRATRDSSAGAERSSSREATGPESRRSSVESRTSESGAASAHEPRSSRMPPGEESGRGSHKASSSATEESHRGTRGESSTTERHAPSAASQESQSSSHKAAEKEKGKSSEKEKGESSSEPHL